MKIQPIAGNVIVESLKREERTTESGLIISDAVAEKIRFVKGTVIAAADVKYVGEREVPMQIKVGDTIYFDEYTAREFTFRGIEYYCVAEEKAYGVLLEDE